jgi:hypothetical protein
MTRCNLKEAPTETPEQHFDAARQYQAYYDEALRNVGARAPRPTLGQRVNDYRRETLRTFKRTFLPPIHELYGAQCRGLDAETLKIFEPQIIAACVKEADNPLHVPPGELRKVERHDQYGVLKSIDWIGQESFVKQMMRPGRRITLAQMQCGKHIEIALLRVFSFVQRSASDAEFSHCSASHEGSTPAEVCSLQGRSGVLLQCQWKFRHPNRTEASQ